MCGVGLFEPIFSGTTTWSSPLPGRMRETKCRRRVNNNGYQDVNSPADRFYPDTTSNKQEHGMRKKDDPGDSGPEKPPQSTPPPSPIARTPIDEKYAALGGMGRMIWARRPRSRRLRTTLSGDIASSKMGLSIGPQTRALMRFMARYGTGGPIPASRRVRSDIRYPMKSTLAAECK